MIKLPSGHNNSLAAPQKMFYSGTKIFPVEGERELRHCVGEKGKTEKYILKAKATQLAMKVSE